MFVNNDINAGVYEQLGIVGEYRLCMATCQILLENDGFAKGGALKHSYIPVDYLHRSPNCYTPRAMMDFVSIYPRHSIYTDELREPNFPEKSNKTVYR